MRLIAKKISNIWAQTIDKGTHKTVKMHRPICVCSLHIHEGDIPKISRKWSKLHFLYIDQDILTRDWVVGNGCKSFGLGSLGIKSSGSTFICNNSD